MYQLATLTATAVSRTSNKRVKVDTEDPVRYGIVAKAEPLSCKDTQRVLIKMERSAT